MQWLSDPGSHTIACSRAWLFSSFSTEQLLSQYLPSRLCESIRGLVVTTTLIHNWGSEIQCPRLSTAELRSIRAFAGSQMVKTLELALHPSSLAKSSIDQLEGLFILLFGTMIAVSYTKATAESLDVRSHDTSSEFLTC